MNKIALRLITLMALTCQLALAEEPPTAGAAASSAAPAAPASGAQAGKGKHRKASVPETEKDRENKKKCRRLGGTWQLGHCNVG